ncbi:hypothetical protein AVEN_43180-1 [Araneus ventricosus]|uniref:Uncharacterized protein n=1 Tax=Araneus ventricosus TaxID=182803 RepID=A0A4Y2EZ19_ARAVE|nr:hypothetical protein AVEN_43180-1 [Araneus ventricosus]
MFLGWRVKTTLHGYEHHYGYDENCWLTTTSDTKLSSFLTVPIIFDEQLKHKHKRSGIRQKLMLVKSALHCISTFRGCLCGVTAPVQNEGSFSVKI